PPAPAAEPAADPAPAAGSATAAGSAGATTPAPAAGSGSAAPTEDPPARTKVVMDESSMTMIPSFVTVPPDFGAKVVAHWTCEMRLGGQINSLERGRLLILYVLIGTGLLLVIGLAFYGIKMTHKVAGPLFKVS